MHFEKLRGGFLLVYVYHSTHLWVTYHIYIVYSLNDYQDTI